MQNILYLQSNNMGMCAHLENIDFSPNFLSHFHVFDFSFIENLYSNFLTRNYMMSHYIGN